MVIHFTRFSVFPVFTRFTCGKVLPNKFLDLAILILIADNKINVN